MSRYPATHTQSNENLTQDQNGISLVAVGSHELQTHAADFVQVISSRSKPDFDIVTYIARAQRPNIKVHLYLLVYRITTPAQRPKKHRATPKLVYEKVLMSPKRFGKLHLDRPTIDSSSCS